MENDRHRSPVLEPPEPSWFANPTLHAFLPDGIHHVATGADPVALFRAAVNAELGWGGERPPGCGPDCVLGCGGAGRSRMFGAVPGQVRAVREFVRLALPGHPAAGDTVAVASELAANTVVHSGSGRPGGVFTVHVLAMGPAAAALTVTELRGGGYPQAHTAGTDTVPGRGLAVVQALTSVFWVADSEQIRILLATIPAPSDQHHVGSPCPRRRISVAGRLDSDNRGDSPYP